MIRVQSILFVLLAPALAGCATTTGTVPHDALRADYERSTRQVAPSAPQMDENARAASIQGPVLARAQYVRAVLRSNPTIESTRQGWRAAIARVSQAGVFEDPMIDLGVAPLSVASSDASLGYEVAISQKLPWFGKRALETTVASAEASAAKSDYESTQRDLALMALELYDQYFVATRALEINAQHIELMRAMRDAAVAQLSSGRGSAQDPLQAEAELAHLEQDAVILASERDVTVAQMNELLHRAPELPLPPPPKELAPPADPSLLDVERLESDAVTHRSEIAAVHHRAHAERARSERAEREYYPDFTVSTSYSSMWDMPEHRWMVGLAFNLPVQTGWRAGAKEEVHATRAQLESEAMRLTDTTRTQVFVALKQLHESKHVLTLFETRLLPVARDQIDAARAGFATAENPFNAVIDAERSLRSVELDYQMARAQYASREARLERALGRIPGLASKEIEQ